MSPLSAVRRRQTDSHVRQRGMRSEHQADKPGRAPVACRKWLGFLGPGEVCGQGAGGRDESVSW